MAWYRLSGSVLLLTFLYFIQGLPYGIQVHFLPIYLRTRGVDLTTVGLLRLLQVPWMFKVLWAPLVDVYLTRSQWLLGSIVALAACCTLSGFCPPDTLGSTAILVLFLWNVFASMEDVAVDSVAVMLLSDQELGAGNVGQVVGYKLGAAFAGGVLALLAGVTGWLGVCIVLAAVYTEAAMLVFVSPLLRLTETNRHCNLSTDNSHDHSPTQFVSCDLCANAEPQTFYAMHHHHHYHHLHHQHHPHGCCHQKPSVSSDGDSSTKKVTGFSAIMDVVCTVCKVPDTKWLAIFLLVYKLGEQGALTMMPMFLLDQKIDATELSFWTGIVCQGISIGGSVLGGWLVTTFNQVPLQFTIQQMCLLRLLPIGIQLLLIVVSNAGLITPSSLFYPAMLSLLLLTLLSGVVTTSTFTLMMQCSRQAPSGVQATHYTMLATCEVVGKLAFTSVCGWLADFVGYRFLFLIFAILSAVVLPWLSRFPSESTSASYDESENFSKAE